MSGQLREFDTQRGLNVGSLGSIFFEIGIQKRLVFKETFVN